MKKLSLLLDSGKNEVYLDAFVRTRTDSKMKVRNAAVYWNFKNATKDANDTIIRGGLLGLRHDSGKTRRERRETGKEQARQHV